MQDEKAVFSERRIVTKQTMLRAVEISKDLQRFTRERMAGLYSYALDDMADEDFAEVNKAIIERWSVSALDYIKKLAWGLREGRRIVTSRSHVVGGGPSESLQRR